MLKFKSGDVLAVVETIGDSGWWMAIKDNRPGYIPKDFVTAFWEFLPKCQMWSWNIDFIQICYRKLYNLWIVNIFLICACDS